MSSYIPVDSKGHAPSKANGALDKAHAELAKAIVGRVGPAPAFEVAPEQARLVLSVRGSSRLAKGEPSQAVTPEVLDPHPTHPEVAKASPPRLLPPETEAGLWTLHPDPWHRTAEEAVWEWAHDRLLGLYRDLAVVLNVQVFAEPHFRKAFLPGDGEPAPWVGWEDSPPGPWVKPSGRGWRWLADEVMKAIRLTPRGIESLDYDAWGTVIDQLMVRHFPESEVRTMAEASATRSFLWEMAREGIEKTGKGSLKDRFLKLPTTLKTALRTYKLGDVATNTLKWLRETCAASVRWVTEKTRTSIKKLVLNAKKDAIGHQELRQRLFHELGENNRDWRQIAITETNNAMGNGYIAGRPPGSYVERMEAADACDYCQEIDGRILRVVPPPKNPKHAERMDWDKTVWAGKDNIGRARSFYSRKLGRHRHDHEMWKPAAGTIHPNCRGRWVPAEKPRRKTGRSS